MNEDKEEKGEEETVRPGKTNTQVELRRPRKKTTSHPLHSLDPAYRFRVITKNV